MNSTGTDSRERVESAIRDADFPRAYRALRTLWASEPSTRTAAFVNARRPVAAAGFAVTRCRLAILRSFTVEPIVGYLQAAAFASGIDLDVRIGDFNAYTQEIVDPASMLYTFEPEVVILALQLSDLSPDFWHRFSSLSSKEAEEEIERVAADIDSLVRTFTARSTAHLVVHTFDLPAAPALGIVDMGNPEGEFGLVQRLNGRLRELAAAIPALHLLDYQSLVGNFGRALWYDPVKWQSVRLPISVHGFGALCREWLRYLHPITGRVAKAVVVDLDNTLWGGVVGEAGSEGIRMADDRAGHPWLGVQRALLDLHNRGIILAIASKNNPGDAMPVLESHADMVLRPEHFAALRINWNDKAQSIREIASELNIGIDAIAFLDDNPAERELVALALPEVHVIDLPEDPAGFAAAIRASPLFERLSLSHEDRERGRLYAEQRQRAELQTGVATLEDYYRSLCQSLQILGPTEQTIPRIAQLTQKTNQFNLTTRRYSEQQIAEMARHPGTEILAVRVRDRFGDNGIVGVAIMVRDGTLAEIDSLLLSCRVIGRTVETALLAVLAERARRKGASMLKGTFLPTARNMPAAGFYPSHEFTRAAEEGEGEIWELDLNEHSVTVPDWITIDNESGVLQDGTGV